MTEPSRLRGYLGYFSILTVLLVPTIGIVNTNRISSISETSFMWPWLMLFRLEPNTAYQTDQYHLITIPWSLILFIPFLYTIKMSFDLTRPSSDKAKTSSYIALTAIIQMLLIWLINQSNANLIQSGIETVQLIFLPQIILLVAHLFFAFTWYYEDINTVLKRKTSITEET